MSSFARLKMGWRRGCWTRKTSVPGSGSAQEGHGLPGNTLQHDAYGGSHWRTHHLLLRKALEQGRVPLTSRLSGWPPSGTEMAVKGREKVMESSVKQAGGASRLPNQNSRIPSHRMDLAFTHEAGKKTPMLCLEAPLCGRRTFFWWDLGRSY